MDGVGVVGGRGGDGEGDVEELDILWARKGRHGRGLGRTWVYS